MRFWSVQVLLALCALMSSASVRAESPAQNASYEDTIRRAVEEYSLGHWTEARFFFARAHAQNPNARTLRGLGLTCYESRNYVEAIDFFKQALASTDQPLTDKMRADLTQLLALSEQFVTRVIVTLEPRTAALEVDHTPRELTKGAILLDPGEHQLSASAKGHHPAQHTIRAAGGEQRVTLRLQAKVESAPVVVLRPTPSQAPALPTRSGGSDLAPYIVMGAGGAALVAGAVLVGIAASDKSAVENAAEGVTWEELEPRYHRGRTFFPVGFALMGVGLAGVAAGLTWKLWPLSEERAPSARLRVSPLGVALSGGF